MNDINFEILVFNFLTTIEIPRLNYPIAIRY